MSMDSSKAHWKSEEHASVVLQRHTSVSKRLGQMLMHGFDHKDLDAAPATVDLQGRKSSVSGGFGDGPDVPTSPTSPVVTAVDDEPWSPSVGRSAASSASRVPMRSNSGCMNRARCSYRVQTEGPQSLKNRSVAAFSIDEGTANEVLGYGRNWAKVRNVHSAVSELSQSVKRPRGESLLEGDSPEPSSPNKDLRI